VSNLRKQTIMTLEAMGIPVEYSFHELGPSQHEIDLRYTDALTMADNVMTFRLVVKEVAQDLGVYATFMPKPIAGDFGSGMHTHLSLFEGDVNAFHDPGDEHGLSKVGKAFIAGLLGHAREITAVTNQWVNSYKRLSERYEAPVYVCWARNNRSALVRVPVAKRKAPSTRIEYRAPDPACNPYLAFSAMLMAGLDGVRNKIEPPEPIDKDLYELPPEEHAAVQQVPASLSEVLDALEDDHEYLFEGGVFTDDLVETWIDFKRTNEIDPIRLRPHPHEFELYFDI
jgi:glutamine synthetase